MTRQVAVPLQAIGRTALHHADLHVRRSSVDLETLKKALANNGRDEVVIQDQRGQHFVIDAVELGGGASAVAIGDHFELGKVSGDVVHIDRDPERVAASLTAMIAGVGSAPLVAKAATLLLGLLNPPAAAVATTLAVWATVVASIYGAMVVSHRPSDDRRLRAVSEDLASSAHGDFDALEKQL